LSLQKRQITEQRKMAELEPRSPLLNRPQNPSPHGSAQVPSQLDHEAPYENDTPVTRGEFIAFKAQVFAALGIDGWD
jgi:hypothetical protein